MDELVKTLTQKAGIAQDKAEQVGQFLKEHAADAPKWIEQENSKLVALLTQKAGLAKDDAEKTVQTLKAHSGDWMKWMGEHAGGMAQKAKDAVAGMFGGKK